MSKTATNIKAETRLKKNWRFINTNSFYKFTGRYNLPNLVYQNLYKFATKTEKIVEYYN